MNWTCSLPKNSRWGGQVSRCPDCGQWWYEKWHWSECYDCCYSEWKRAGWLRMHTQFRHELKHFKAVAE